MKRVSLASWEEEVNIYGGKKIDSNINGLEQAADVPGRMGQVGLTLIEGDNILGGIIRYVERLDVSSSAMSYPGIIAELLWKNQNFNVQQLRHVINPIRSRPLPDMTPVRGPQPERQAGTRDKALAGVPQQSYKTMILYGQFCSSYGPWLDDLCAQFDEDKFAVVSRGGFTLPRDY